MTRSSRVGGLAQPEPSRDDVGAHRILAASRDGCGEGRLIDRLGREAEVERLAVRLLHPVERVEQEPLELAGVARLRVGEAGRLDSDPRRRERLMRAALAGEGDPGRRAGEDETGARVGRVDDALERAHDERVVDGADRKEPFTLEVPGEAELPEQEDEVHLGDPHLDVLARAGRRAS